MNRPDVIRQPLGIVIASFVAIMLTVIARAAYAPSPVGAELCSDMPLGRFIDRIFPTAALSCTVGIVIAFLSAALLTGIIVRYSISSVRTYLPMIIYTLSAYGIYFPSGSVSATLLPLLLIMSSGQAIAGFKRSYQFGSVFRSAFYIGIIPMIYAPASLLVIMVPVTLLLYRRTLREAIAALTGVVLPWVLCSVAWWGAGFPLGYVSSDLWRGITAAGASESFTEAVLASGISEKIFLAFYTVLCIYSVIIIIPRLASLRTRARKIYIHFLWLLFVCVAILFSPAGNVISAGLLAVPGCVIITTFFIRYRGWLPLSAYIMLILSVMYINISSVVQ